MPERVPTAQSSDDEIKEFSAWLSLSLEREDTVEETEQADLNTSDDREDDQINYTQDGFRIESVIWNRWKHGLENSDIETVYVRDMGRRLFLY